MRSATRSTSKFSDGVVNIVNYTLGAVGPIKGTIRRLGEPVQYESEVLEQLRVAGVMPGAATASFTAAGRNVRVQVDGAVRGDRAAQRMSPSTSTSASSNSS
jgi:DtxR family Mn-dependent transcriptional regulator